MARNDTDADAIRRFLGGERGAFDELVLRYKGLAYTVILKIVGNRQSAEDLLQETFACVYRALPSLRTPDRFKAWLLRIATNEAIKHLRRRQPTALTLDGMDEGSDRLLSEAAEKLNTARIDEIVDRHFELERVAVALRKLPVIYKNALVLRYFAKLSYKEICDAVGCNLATVKFRIHHGMKLLRAQVLRKN